MTKKTTDRQRFERWARSIPKNKFPGKIDLEKDEENLEAYFFIDAALLWEGWQAALRSERRRGNR